MVQQAERADARANRARLIAAAHEVFRERGWDAEMKEIAERAGLGIGTIYRNFPTKEDLIVAIFTEAFDEMQSVFRAVLALDDPVEAIRAFIRAGLGVVQSYGHIFLAMMQSQLPPACKTQFEKLDKLEPMAGVVRRGIDRGIFRADLDPVVTAAKIVSSLFPWTFFELRRMRSFDQIVDAYTDLILHGTLKHG
jgi:AcrR family transcriptional regulator